MNQNDKLDPISDEIDLRLLIIPLWTNRKKIILIALIFGSIGGVLGFLNPVTYTASSTFLPQTSQSGGGTSGLGGLAALAGINLNTTSAGGDIPPSMYSTILGSEFFRMRILDSKILLNGDSITYRSYLENRPVSTLGIIREYTIGLPGKIIGLPGKFLGLLVPKEEEKLASNELQGLQPLSDNEYGLLNAVSGKVSIINDKEEGIITISVVESDPIIAAQITKVTEEVLQSWISEHKMKNAKAQYDFITKQFEAKQKEFFVIQNQLASYMDRNQNVLSQTSQIRVERLQAEFDLVQTVYSELAKQKEQAAIQLSKDTPTFSVLDPVKVPRVKDGLSLTFYVLGGFFIGLFSSSVWFVARKSVREFIYWMQANT